MSASAGFVSALPTSPRGRQGCSCSCSVGDFRSRLASSLPLRSAGPLQLCLRRLALLRNGHRRVAEDPSVAEKSRWHSHLPACPGFQALLLSVVGQVLGRRWCLAKVECAEALGRPLKGGFQNPKLSALEGLKRPGSVASLPAWCRPWAGSTAYESQCWPCCWPFRWPLQPGI